MPEVMAIGDRTNNAQMIADAQQLGYIGDRVLDMTYGKGRFWRTAKTPLYFVSNDLDESCDCAHHYDFTDLPPTWTGAYDTVVFDPPYKLNGTGGSHPSDEGYGVDDKIYTKGRMGLIHEGVSEAVRVCAPKGHIIVKCQDQVVSGQKLWQTFGIAALGLSFDLRLEDMLHVRSYRPQPPGRRQLHSRQDYSTALIFVKDR